MFPVSSAVRVAHRALCLSNERSAFIRGLRIAGTDVKVLAYAEDIAVFCSDVEGISGAVWLMGIFCEASCAAVNCKISCRLLYTVNRSWCPTFLRLFVKVGNPVSI